jgi:hypothetical protein
MISKLTLSFITILIGAVVPVLGQDLGQLTDRASKFWESRKSLKKADALQFVDPGTLETYLQLSDSPISSFKLSGLEFTDDARRVNVLVKVRSLVPSVGEMDRIVKEEWVWKNGQWFMQASSVKSLFDSETKPVSPFVLEFQVKETVVDVGRRAQGEVIGGKITFRAPRNDIRNIRPAQTITGLAINNPIWTSPTEGYLSYRWETTLLSENFSQTIALEAIAVNDMRTSVEVQFRARIDGRIGFKQAPALIDPDKSGQVELHLQNLSAKPLRILSVMSYNPAYVVDDNVPEVIEPGKSGRLLIRYVAQADARGASIGFVFSEDLGGKPITTVPLNMRTPVEKRAAPVTPEDIKRLCGQPGVNCGTAPK